MFLEYIVYIGIAYNASLKPWDESRYFIPWYLLYPIVSTFL